MSYALIQLDFKNVAVTEDSEYLMRTIVNSISTPYPDILESLVIEKGTSSNDEVLLRVATLSEFSTSPLPVLPSVVNIFSSVLFPYPFEEGDIIKIVSPNKWLHLHSTPEQFDIIVRDNTDPSNPVVEPTDEMQDLGFSVIPSFARKLSFKVYDDTYVDGLVNRDYSGFSGYTRFRSDNHDDTWDDLIVAQNKFAALPGQAQELVNDLNEDNWSGEFSKRIE